MDDIEWAAFSHYRNQIKNLNRRVDNFLATLKLMDNNDWVIDLLKADEAIIDSAVKKGDETCKSESEQHS